MLRRDKLAIAGPIVKTLLKKIIGAHVRASDFRHANVMSLLSRQAAWSWAFATTHRRRAASRYSSVPRATSTVGSCSHAPPRNRPHMCLRAALRNVLLLAGVPYNKTVRHGRFVVANAGDAIV